MRDAVTYAIATPSPALRPYVKRYWRLRGRFDVEESLVLLPDAGAHLVLSLGEGVRSDRYGDVLVTHETVMVGAMLRSDVQRLSSEQHVVGVTFRPGGFPCFYEWGPLSRIANEVQPFDRSFPEEALRRLVDMDRLARCLDRFFLDRLVPGRADLLRVLADITACHGRVRVDDLMRRHAVTARWLERRFARRVGIGPKAFIDLTRFEHVRATIEADRGRHTLDRLARDCGYYDGAHLTNAFQRYVGRSPSRLTLSDLSKSAAGSDDIVAR